MIILFTGLSGSGKTTLSDLLKERLEKSSYSVHQIDGDIFRKEEKSKNRFTRKEILANNSQIISYCQSVEKNYDFVILSVIFPYQEMRDRARETFKNNYFEIFLDCPLGVLIKRDPKKFYAKALAGKIKNPIGLSPESPYELPKRCDLKINTNQDDINSSLNKIWTQLKIKQS